MAAVRKWQRPVDCMHRNQSDSCDGKAGLLTADIMYCVPRDALSSPALEWNPRVIAPGLRPLGPSLQAKHSEKRIAPIFCARPPLMPAKQSFCTTVRLCSRVLQERYAHQLRLTGAAHARLRPPAVCAPYCVAGSVGSCVTLWPSVASQGSWKYGVSWSLSPRWRLSQPVSKFQ
jgi:hypothetical protein